MQLSIKTNFPQVQRRLDALGKQATFATAVALTRTAQDLKQEELKTMQRVFDRPTRYTLNSLVVIAARKDKLEASVFIKNTERHTHYLWPEIDGGRRPMKRFEQLLQQRGLIASSERLVPAAGAKIDAYGNMSRGQIVQIVSQLGAFNLSGHSANATNSKRSKAKRAAVQYFFARKGEARMGLGAWKRGEKVQHLPTGIYARTAQGIVPVLIVVKTATYRKLFPFNEVGRRAVHERFEAHFEVEYAKALRTARWGSR